jgi:hypothetical protein
MPVGTYGQVKQVIENQVQNLASSEKEKIFGSNTVRFYNLTLPHGPATHK